MDARAPQDLVGQLVADSGEDPLVRQGRLGAPPHTSPNSAGIPRHPEARASRCECPDHGLVKPRRRARNDGGDDATNLMDKRKSEPNRGKSQMEKLEKSDVEWRGGLGAPPDQGVRQKRTEPP